MQQQLCAIKTESKTSGRKNVRTTHEQSRGSLARTLISHKQPTKMPAMRGKRGMKSEGKIQWLDKWVRERKRERQRGRESWCRSRNTKTVPPLSHWTGLWQRGERVGEMRGGIWETISPTLSGRFPHHAYALHTLKNIHSSNGSCSTLGSAKNPVEGSWVRDLKSWKWFKCYIEVQYLHLHLVI